MFDPVSFKGVGFKCRYTLCKWDMGGDSAFFASFVAVGVFDIDSRPSAAPAELNSCRDSFAG
jgi:hypothetical protein